MQASRCRFKVRSLSLGLRLFHKSGVLRANESSKPRSHRFETQDGTIQGLEDGSAKYPSAPLAGRRSGTKSIFGASTLKPNNILAIKSARFAREFVNRFVPLSQSATVKQIFDSGAKQTRNPFLAFQTFWRRVQATKTARAENPSSGPTVIPSVSFLRDVYIKDGRSALDSTILNLFKAYIQQGQTETDGRSSVAAHVRAKFSNPAEWFAKARAVNRKIHLHVGPTNSGKTYHALRRLEQAKKGWIAGPLRMLALEMYDRLNAKGIPCNLITGEERRIVSVDAPITSSTIEMTNLEARVEVAVFDEIQMIADPDRGWAWTEAILGMAADEVHVCGEERACDVVRALAESVGDTVEIHRYQRLAPLEPLPSGLNGDLTLIQPGDCIVTFARPTIFELKRQVEEATGMTCAVAYGGLPAEIRAEQARLFNDPESGYDVLVATDAVGMGLNLSIKRIIFHAVEKFDGREMVNIADAHIKQIAGRAGRFKSASHVSTTGLGEAPSNIGYVTTLSDKDLTRLHQALNAPIHPIRTAGITARLEHLREFSAVHPNAPFSALLSQFAKKTRTSSKFHICDFNQKIELAKCFDKVSGLTLAQRFDLCSAPLSARNPLSLKLVIELAAALASGQPHGVMDMNEIDIEAVEADNVRNMSHLLRLELLHRHLMAFLWLQQRFPVAFVSHETTLEVKARCEELITKGLKRIQVESGSGKEQRKWTSSKQFKTTLMRASQVIERRRTAGSELSAKRPVADRPQHKNWQHQHVSVAGKYAADRNRSAGGKIAAQRRFADRPPRAKQRQHQHASGEENYAADRNFRRKAKKNVQ